MSKHTEELSFQAVYDNATYRLGLKRETTNSLTWVELDLLYHYDDLKNQREWERSRELMSVIINKNRKRGQKNYKGKDIIKLDKLDNRNIHKTVTKKARRRLRERAEKLNLI